MKHINIICLLAITVFVFESCKHDESDPNVTQESKYPENVANIIVNKCATSGCHTDQSKVAAGGLSLETWDKMFEGSNGGAVVIPYRPDYSTLMYYINHDSLLIGPQLSPTMPVNGTPLTIDELQTLRDWITAGAPDKNGFIMFSDNPSRQKYYVTNQGCDVVTVFDANSTLAMRAVDVGASPLVESPHAVHVSYDNQYWYTCFIGGAYFQKYSTYDNSLVAQVNIGPASWNTFCLSTDNQYAYVIAFDIGRIAKVDLNTMTAVFYNGFGNPHGSVLNPTNDTLYVTAQLASYLFKIPVNDVINYEIIDLVQSFPSPAAELEPHEAAFSPDGTKLFVTCDESDDVRVVDRATNTVIAAIPVGLYPVEMAFSHHHPYLFVTCMDALNADPNQRGAVAVIDYTTNTLIKTIYPGYQPHGIAVDDYNGRVYVANRNIDTNGPPPHHTSLCGGRNGYVSIIDMNTLELVPGGNTEVSVDPYGLGITH